MTSQIELIVCLIITLHVHLHANESGPHLPPAAKGTEGNLNVRVSQIILCTKVFFI